MTQHQHRSGKSNEQPPTGGWGGGDRGAASDMTDPDSLMALPEKLIFLSQRVFSCLETLSQKLMFV